MKYLAILFACFVFKDVYSAEWRLTSSKQDGTRIFRGTRFTELPKYLDKIKGNLTHIIVEESTIPNIPGHTFARFGVSLVVLNLHECGIQVIDPYALIGLTRLEQLILWGNKLTWIPKDWFANMQNLRTLDLSFNFITGIEYPVFQMLPYLENFYLDYNQFSVIDFSMFAYLRNLKRVRFGKNPWNWAYRARLTWQLENQNVQYIDDWENWSWMNAVIKDCIESGQGELPSDKVLDCAVEKLLDFAYEAMQSEQIDPWNSINCRHETRYLVSCMRPKNSTGNTDSETVRMVLQDYSAILPSMQNSQSRFTTLSGEHRPLV